MLKQILEQEEFSLALTPGFFRFYAHAGVLHAMEEYGCLKVCHIAGSSAGAIVGAFLASGLKPSEMLEPLFSMRRSDMWDLGGIGGLLKGDAAHNLLKKHLLVENIEDCPIPLSVTAFDLYRLRTNCISEGCLATATRASFTFPGLFQPVMIDGRPHIDGGVWDHAGLFAMEECFKSSKNRASAKLSTSSSAKLSNSTSQKVVETSSTKSTEESNMQKDAKEDIPSNPLIVNVVFDTEKGSILPQQLKHCRLLTIILENIPAVSPFTMETKGREAYSVSKAAMKRALENGAHIQEREANHWICYIDGSKVKQDEIGKSGIADTFSSKSPNIPVVRNDISSSSSSSKSVVISEVAANVPQDQDVAFSRNSSAMTDEFLLVGGETSSAQSSYVDDVSIENNTIDEMEKLANEGDGGVQDDVTQIQYFSFINNGSFKFPNVMFDAMTRSAPKNILVGTEDDISVITLSKEDAH